MNNFTFSAFCFYAICAIVLIFLFVVVPVISWLEDKEEQESIRHEQEINE